jgi:saccharopine dehydrogenase (NAD+, L-lysine-forming)
MIKAIGIRREDKNIWERRVPLIPEHVKKLKDQFNIQTVLQPFPKRAFTEEEYIKAGAVFNEDLSECPVILAVKEIPIKLISPKKTYIFFSHTIKGQDYNMPLLKKVMDEKCTLIDYECIKNDENRRLVFFGRFAGVAGMIDAFYGYGQRLKALGYSNILENAKPAYEYDDMEDAKKQLAEVGEKIKLEGLPEEKAPYVFGFTGYGNVSKGAQEIFDIMPHEEITPDQLASLTSKDNKKFYKVVFKEEHMVKTKNPEHNFELLDYFNNPEKYESKFEDHIPYLSAVINCIFWNENYPRFITKDYFKNNSDIKLDVVCDITCDIDGAVEFTNKATPSDNPAYIYNPKDDSFVDGYAGEGIVDIAVDNLPTELPRDSSVEFSDSLNSFIPGIVEADLSLSFEEVNYPNEIKRAVIVYKGELTPDFEYLKEYLNK